jgi:tetratricopeptide (TPR) repeat protein
MHHFARGIALSAKGNAADARAELASMEKLASTPALKEQKILDLNSLEEIARIGVAMLRGDIAQKAGRFDEALAEFERAVEIDDGLLYAEPPDWFLPPRQYLANAYLSADKYADAERVYRADLKRHRANGLALRGLEQALRVGGTIIWTKLRQLHL